MGKIANACSVRSTSSISGIGKGSLPKADLGCASQILAIET